MSEEKKSDKKEDVPCEKAGDELKSVSFGVLITTAFGLVAALAWNDAIQRLITYYLGDAKNSGVWFGVLYAVVVTLLILLLLWIIRKVYMQYRKQRCAIEKKMQGKKAAEAEAATGATAEPQPAESEVGEAAK